MKQLQDKMEHEMQCLGKMQLYLASNLTLNLVIEKLHKPFPIVFY